MSERKDGGPAFPIPSAEMAWKGQSVKETQGMSLRDYFAAAALTGLTSNANAIRAIEATMKETGIKSPNALYAQLAWDLAKAMLAEREKP